MSAAFAQTPSRLAAARQRAEDAKAALANPPRRTNRGSAWLLVLYAVSIAAIGGLLAARAPHYGAWNPSNRSAASS